MNECVRPAARLLGLVVVSVLVSVTAVNAQIQTGSILVRTAHDEAPVPGATVTITSPNLVANQMVGATDAGGVYRFPSLPPGTYAVTISLQGFKTILREGVVVRVGQTTSLGFTLELSGVEETLTVTAESPVVDLTSANVGVNLDAQLLDTTPGGRDIWSIVEYKVPGVTMSRPDVGGNQGGLQRALEARGTANNQNTQMLNGVNVGDPAAIGYAGYYYDPSAFEDIQVSSGAQDITVSTGGVFINMVTKSGRNNFNGSALFTYQGNGTQWDNIDSGLQDAGIRPEANAVNWITNTNLNFGGPIIRNRLFFFSSFNDQRTHVNVVGFPAVPTEGIQDEPTDITSIFVRPTFQLNEAHRFDVTASAQVYDKPNRGASATRTPESTWHEHDILAVYQGLWNWVLNNRLFADTRVSYNSIDFPLNLKTDKQYLRDNTTNIRTRANTTDQVMFRERLQISSNWNYYVPQFTGGRHELRFGIDNSYTPDSVTINRNDDLELRWRSDRNEAVEVRVYNTPLFVKRAVMVTALYAQDSFSIDRATFTGGIRFERVEGWLPAQSSPPSRWFPEGTVLMTNVGGVPTPYVVRRDFEEVRDIPLWKNVGPRLSAIFDVFGDGRTALKASAARYFDAVGTGTPGGLNPNGTIQQRYRWNDLNGDLVFQDGELGALTRTSVPATLETLRLTRDENITRPYRNEWTVGVDHELRPNFLLSGTWIWRKEQNQLTNVELNVPFSAYTPIDVTEPGRDGLMGTADDQVITVYNENLPLQTHVTQQQNDDRVSERYKGIEITANKRYSDGWTLLAGYTWGRTDVDLTNVTTPNAALVNATGRTRGREHVIKVTGSYLLPYEIMLGGNFRLESGAFITRNVNISGLNQGTINVNAEPRGSETLDWLPTLDLRARKSFPIGAYNLDLDFDVYNLTNANTIFNVRTNTGRINVRQAGDPNGELNNIPTFLSPTGVLGPRIIRFNVSFQFGR